MALDSETHDDLVLERDSVTRNGRVLLRWKDAEGDDPAEGAIVRVGQGRTWLASGEIESFCFTTAKGTVFLAVRSSEPSIASPYEVRRVPIMSRASDAELLVDDSSVRVAVVTMAPDETIVVYDVVCTDTRTLRLEFNAREERRTNIGRSAGGSATLVPPAGVPKSPRAHTEQTDEFQLIELEVTPSGDFFRPFNERVRPELPARQWPARLKAPAASERVRMPEVAAVLDLFLREHEIALVVDELIAQAKKTQHSLLVVGGVVRDALLRGSLNDADLDLAGDIPPSMFRYWVRQIGAALDLDLMATTSSTNVTRIYCRDGQRIRAVAEYALFKYKRSGSAWSGCNDLYLDYATRDLAENTLMYDPSTKEILSASDRFVGWCNENGTIDRDKYSSRLTVISADGYQLHKSLETWAYVNVLARLMKSYARFVRASRPAPDVPETARAITNLLSAIQDDVDAVCREIDVEREHVLAAAMVEACPESVGTRREAANWLRMTLEQAAGPERLEMPLFEAWRAAEALACGPDPAWTRPKDLEGYGLATRRRDGGRWVVDPLGIELKTGLTPALVSRKLGAIVAGWKEVGLPGIARGDDEVTARAFQNPIRSDRYLVVVDTNGRPVVAQSPSEAPLASKDE